MFFFFSSYGVCRCSTIKSSPLLFFSFIHNDIWLHIRARFLLQFSYPTDESVVLSLLAHFQPLQTRKRKKERERETERQRDRETEGNGRRKNERKSTGKKLRVRAISSKNVVIVVCSQVTMDCQEKPEPGKKDNSRVKEDEDERARFLICVNEEEGR